jgi:hypothetical protein
MLRLGNCNRLVPDRDLAVQFWRSPWGSQAAREDADITLPLVAFLTADWAAGGLQASWSDPVGLRGLRDFVSALRPAAGHGQA